MKIDKELAEAIMIGALLIYGVISEFHRLITALLLW